MKPCHAASRFTQKALCIAVVFLIVCLSALYFGIGAAAAEDAYEEISVQWNNGYVGSAGNRLGNENKLGSVGSANTSYRYTDVVTIEKAGTEVTFTEKGSGSSGYCSYTGYAISSWILENGIWVLDVDGANYQGSTTGQSQGIAVRSGNTMTYTYVTSRDNENLRFCFSITNDKDSAGNVVFPKIYKRYTGAEGTYARQLERDSTQAVFEIKNDAPADGVYSGLVKNVVWFDGYIGSSSNADFYVNEIYPYVNGYRYTSVICVPYAGTTISFSDILQDYAGDDVYVISSWTKYNDLWLHDAADSNLTGADSSAYKDVDSVRTYSYTTERDGECIRLCFRSTSGLNDPRISFTSENPSYAPATETEPPEQIPTEEPTQTDVPLPPETEPTQNDNEENARMVKIAALCLALVAYVTAWLLIKRNRSKLLRK